MIRRGCFDNASVNPNQGDLIHTTDFRSVYATVLDRWMGADSERVLGSRFNNLEFV